MTLLPTPDSYSGSRGGSQHPSKRRSGGHAVSIADVAEHVLMPTPRATRGGSATETVELLPTPKAGDADFGVYSPAVQRWEAAIGRPAPAPTEPSPNGRPRLSAKFTEWMMGLPAGWVTDPALGLSRVQQLRLLGNGVVPQQAEHALRLMLARSSGGAA